MPASKLSVVRLCARILPLACSVPVFCTAATLVVNNETPLNISTPPGFTYVVSGTDASLTVPTDGYLFCANASLGGGGSEETPVTVIPQHVGWVLPAAQDVRTVGYNSGVLGVNHGTASTLSCRGVGAQGEVGSPYGDGLFRSGIESKTNEQYANLINWVPPQGFSWSAPNWSLVPADPCNPSDNEPTQVVEDVACGAVTGLRGSPTAGPVRAATLWTATDGANFYYVVRVDARFGVQQRGQSGPHVPVLESGNEPDTGASTVLTLVDGYNRGASGAGDGYLGDIGQWCALATAPTSLDAGVCDNATYSASLFGPLNVQIPLSVFPPEGQRASFYVAFIRPIVGAPPVSSQPAVAVSILLEAALTAEGGDEFKGDDVAFGFLPTATGFPWMTGGQ